MELCLVPSPDPAVVEAARSAAADLGFVSEAATAAQDRWWEAGIEDGLAARLSASAWGERYEVARSPRSTRGATRA